MPLHRAENTQRASSSIGRHYWSHWQQREASDLFTPIPILFQFQSIERYKILLHVRQPEKFVFLYFMAAAVSSKKKIKKYMHTERKKN